MGDIPFDVLVLPAVTYGAVPALMIAFLFGGRGIVMSICLAVALGLAYLLYFFGLRPRDDWTGMEGVLLYVIPALIAALSAVLGIGYGLVRLLGMLPWQRRQKERRD